MSELESLYRRPPNAAKGYVATYENELQPNAVQQADLVELPDDDGHKYALTLVDLASRVGAAVPLKGKSAEDVLRGLKEIYDNPASGIKRANELHVPLRFEVDSGKEFMGAVTAFLAAHGTKIRRAVPGRHQQQRLVEAFNKVLGLAIMKRQAAEELLTHSVSREWVADLPDYVAAINLRWQRAVPPPEPAPRSLQLATPPASERDILPLGTEVRVLLDHPQSVLGTKVTPGSGRTGFRAGDIRWSPEIYVVSGNSWVPTQSLRYMVSRSGKEVTNVSYARHQLQVVTEADKTPPDGRTVVRNPDEKTFLPSKLHGKRKGSTVEFLTEWRGYPDKEDWTWTRRIELMASTEGKRLVKAFKS